MATKTKKRPELVSIAKAAEILGVTQATIRKNRFEWGLTVYRIGKSVRFDARELDEFVAKHAYRA